MSSPAAPFTEQERFAVYVAHELRAPIALQRTLLEVTLADPDADTGALREIGARVIASCEQQERLIDALLDLARSRFGPRREEPVDLAAVTAEALARHDLSGLESVVMLEQAWTTGDPDLIARLVANLVSNAIRHNVVGGRIELVTRTASACSVLSVASAGPLIPPGELQRLFQPFQRLALHRTGASDGIGLGLAIVQAIADAHNAVISARTRASGGLDIEVSFPVDPRPRAAPRAANDRRRGSPSEPHRTPVAVPRRSTVAV